MTKTRTALATAILFTLAACGGDAPVREGPQAVHPSTSALAQGTATATCHSHNNKGCHGHASDGSAPIID